MHTFKEQVFVFAFILTFVYCLMIATTYLHGYLCLLHNKCNLYCQSVYTKYYCMHYLLFIMVLIYYIKLYLLKLAKSLR